MDEDNQDSFGFDLGDLDKHQEALIGAQSDGANLEKGSQSGSFSASPQKIKKPALLGSIVSSRAKSAAAFRDDNERSPGTSASMFAPITSLSMRSSDTGGSITSKPSFTSRIASRASDASRNIGDSVAGMGATGSSSTMTNFQRQELLLLNHIKDDISTIADLIKDLDGKPSTKGTSDILKGHKGAPNEKDNMFEKLLGALMGLGLGAAGAFADKFKGGAAATERAVSAVAADVGKAFSGIRDLLTHHDSPHRMIKQPGGANLFGPQRPAPLPPNTNPNGRVAAQNAKDMAKYNRSLRGRVSNAGRNIQNAASRLKNNFGRMMSNNSTRRQTPPRPGSRMSRGPQFASNNSNARPGSRTASGPQFANAAADFRDNMFTRFGNRIRGIGAVGTLLGVGQTAMDAFQHHNNLGADAVKGFAQLQQGGGIGYVGSSLAKAAATLIPGKLGGTAVREALFKFGESGAGKAIGTALNLGARGTALAEAPIQLLAAEGITGADAYNKAKKNQKWESVISAESNNFDMRRIMERTGNLVKHQLHQDGKSTHDFWDIAGNLGFETDSERDAAQITYQKAHGASKSQLAKMTQKMKRDDTSSNANQYDFSLNNMGQNIKNLLSGHYDSGLDLSMSNMGRNLRGLTSSVNPATVAAAVSQDVKSIEKSVSSAISQTFNVNLPNLTVQSKVEIKKLIEDALNAQRQAMQLAARSNETHSNVSNMPRPSAAVAINPTKAFTG